MEIWKDIVVDREEKYKYKGVYKVSNFGRVKRLYKNGNELILKPMENIHGYYYVGLRGQRYLIHRLVLLAFDYDSYFVKADVNHKDENPKNNNLSNLEWCTRKYNINYGKHNERMSKTKTGMYVGKLNPAYGTNTNGKEIICINNLKIYPSARQAGVELNLDNSTISKICKGKKKTTHGYKFMYLNNYLQQVNTEIITGIKESVAL